MFIFCVIPPKTKISVSRAQTPFLEITKKVITKNAFHGLELIILVPGFLKTFSLKLTTIKLPVVNISENPQENKDSAISQKATS